MLCRVCLLLGLAPSEARELPASDYDLLQRYWAREPWGPHRDHMIMAISTSTLFNLHRGKNRPLTWQELMPTTRAEYDQRRASGILEFFRAAARPRQ